MRGRDYLYALSGWTVGVIFLTFTCFLQYDVTSHYVVELDTFVGKGSETFRGEIGENFPYQPKCTPLHRL